MNNQILAFEGLQMFIVAGALYFANKNTKENENLECINKTLENENKDLWTKNLDKLKKIKVMEKQIEDLDYTCKIRKETVKNKEIAIKNGYKEISKLNEIIEFDNKIMSKRMNTIGDLQEDVRKGAERFSKDQVKISELEDMNKARYEENLSLRRKMKKIRAKRLLKVVRAERIGGVENV